MYQGELEGGRGLNSAESAVTSCTVSVMACTVWSSPSSSGEALDSVLAVSSNRSKMLKEGYVSDLTR